MAYYAKADRVRLVFPSPFFRNMPTPVIVEGMEEGKPFEKEVIASMKEAFKEEMLHFAECVQQGKTPLTTPEEAKGDVALLHKIFQAIKRPLQLAADAGRGPVRPAGLDCAQRTERGRMP